MITDWDDAYANRAHVPEAPKILDPLATLAAEFRDTTSGEIDIAYGTSEREKLDLFLPEGTPKGLAVFVHGGYWILFDKSSWSHYAAGLLKRGFAVAMPSYPVSPDARLPEISAAVGRAIAAAAQRIVGPIHLVGHSAGGHLVARMVTDQSPLDPSLRQRINTCVPISGLFDLRPMLRLAMNADWKLDQNTAISESPAFQMPDPHIRITAVVGGAERPEFLRHTDLLVNAWTGCGAHVTGWHLAGRHHFDVIAGLLDAEDPLTALVAG